MNNIAPLLDFVRIILGYEISLVVFVMFIIGFLIGPHFKVISSAISIGFSAILFLVIMRAFVFTVGEGETESLMITGYFYTDLARNYLTSKPALLNLSTAQLNAELLSYYGGEAAKIWTGASVEAVKWTLAAILSLMSLFLGTLVQKIRASA